MFHRGLDELNKFQTVVCNWKTDTYHRVNSFGFWILKVINEHPDSTMNEIVNMISTLRKENVWQNEVKVKNFIEKMVRENVVVEL